MRGRFTPGFLFLPCLALSALAEPAPDLLPTPKGAEWTFQVRPQAAEVTTHTTVRVSSVPAGSEVSFGADANSRPVEEGVRLSGAWVAGPGSDALLIERAPDGTLKIAVQQWGVNLFAARFVVPGDVKPGATWTGHQLHPSCGLLAVPTTFSATRESLTLGVGSFDTLRIDAVTNWGKQTETESLWLVDGLGIVKSRISGQVLELTSSSLLQTKQPESEEPTPCRGATVKPTVVISACMYSGREDPHWTPSTKEIQDLQARLSALRPTNQAAPRQDLPAFTISGLKLHDGEQVHLWIQGDSVIARVNDEDRVYHDPGLQTYLLGLAQETPRADEIEIGFGTPR